MPNDTSGRAPKPADAVSDAQTRMTGVMAAMMQAQGKMFDTMLRQNIEMLDFMKMRFERDRALLSAFAEVRKPDEAPPLWSDFWQGLMADYANEATKLTAMMATTREEMIEGLTKEGQAMAGVMTFPKGD